jgi:hypothetical protein
MGLMSLQKKPENNVRDLSFAYSLVGLNYVRRCNAALHWRLSAVLAGVG